MNSVSRSFVAGEMHFNDVFSNVCGNGRKIGIDDQPGIYHTINSFEPLTCKYYIHFGLGRVYSTVSSNKAIKCAII